MLKKLFFTLIVFSFVVATLYPSSSFSAQDLAQKMSGWILLQVEQNGEAWYVNPKDNQRYFMGRPKDAFNLMRKMGIGITSEQLQKIPIGGIDNLTGEDSDGDGLSDVFEDAIGTDKNNSDSDNDGYLDKEELKNNFNPNGSGTLKLDNNFAQVQVGKIFLQVENNGEAWYINPKNNRRYFLGRPADAFVVMRNLGQGISNENLNLIEKQEKGTSVSPESDKLEFVEEKVDYEMVSYFKEAGGKLIYVGSLSDGRSVVVYDNKEQGKYLGVDNLIEVNNNLAYSIYTTTQDNSLYYYAVVYNGQEKGEYSGVTEIKELNDKLVYTTSPSNSILFYDDKVYDKYRSQLDPEIIDGELAYIAKDDDNKYFVVHNGEEQKKYDLIYGLTNINNKLSYAVREEDQSYIIYGDEKYGGYSDVSSPEELNNKLAFFAQDNGKFVVYDGEEQKKYDDILQSTWINDRLVYAVKDKEKSFIVYGDEEQKKYGQVVSLLPKGINNELVYMVRENDKDFIVYGSEEQKKYDYISYYKEINGKLTYIVQDKGKSFVVYGGEELKKYDTISPFSIFEMDNKLIYSASENGQTFIVKEK